MKQKIFKDFDFSYFEENESLYILKGLRINFNIFHQAIEIHEEKKIEFSNFEKYAHLLNEPSCYKETPL